MQKVNLILLISSFITWMSSPVSAQSKAAYTKAGDACILRNDPFCGINNYRLALEYEEDAPLCFKMGNAEKLLHNYAAALNWFQRCLNHSPEKEMRIDAFLEKVDLHKRLLQFEFAYAGIDSLRRIESSKETTWNDLLVDYKNAEILSSVRANIDVYPEPGDVNTAYSDFAPAALGDTLLYYSSLRFSLLEKNNQVSTSRIASVKTNEASREKSKVLPETINMPAFNDANATISPDGKIMVFTRCLYDDNGKLNCALYESEYINGKWKEGVKLTSEINPNGRTSTQPHLATNKSEGYILFFSSNKSGGKGGMDIWMSKRSAKSQYASPINLGATVNSEADEWTPFYDIEKDTLYFSSEKQAGLGGLDIYKIGFNAYQKNMASGLPPPYNSGYNDLYYTKSYGEKNQTFLVSNRPPAARLNGSSCCYDIFRVVPVIPVVDRVLAAGNGRNTGNDSLPATADAGTDFEKLPLEMKIDNIKLNFPIRLYFDNDNPDPRSRLNNTDKRYDRLAEDYLKRKAEYVNQQANESLKEKITDFFKDSVALNFSKLEEFTYQLFYLLANSSSRLKITILGSASPLAETRYNLILSNRRIKSLENYWLQQEDNRFKTWLSEKKIEIIFLPKGEEEAAKTVSDQTKDVRKSIYSKDAAMERRIEIVDITLVP